MTSSPYRVPTPAQPLGFASQSTWPSNNANGFSGTVGADLPWKSRYVGTVSYTMMRQNDAFMPNEHVDPDGAAVRRA